MLNCLIESDNDNFVVVVVVIVVHGTESLAYFLRGQYFEVKCVTN